MSVLHKSAFRWDSGEDQRCRLPGGATEGGSADEGAGGGVLQGASGTGLLRGAHQQDVQVLCVTPTSGGRFHKAVF